MHSIVSTGIPLNPSSDDACTYRSPQRLPPFTFTFTFAFFTGALSDYHLHNNFQDPELPALMLSSGCVGDPVLARVWDTFVPWRTMFKGAPYANLSLLSPTVAYARQLPRQRLPAT